MQFIKNDYQHNEEILVSVIVPVYNTETYLEKCINSLLNQKHSNIEIWLIDDGSSDGSPGICDRFALENRNVYVIHKENEGQAVARNVALDLCTGQYIVFVDSDDSIDPYYIERMLTEAVINNAELVVCGFCVDNGIRKDKISHIYSHYDNFGLYKEYLTDKYISTVLWNKLYKKSLFSDVRFPRIRANEDAYVLPRVFSKVTKAVIVPECLYTQFARNGSTERTAFSDNKLALLQVSDETCKVIEENVPKLLYFAEFKRACETMALLDMIAYEKKVYKYINIYNELQVRLYEECQEIIQKYDVPVKDRKVLDRMLKLSQNSRSHIIQGKVKRTKQNLKNMVKIVLIKAKSGL